MSAAMLTLILLGAGAPDASGRPIGYEVKVHEMEGLAWRSALHSRMTAIARPGSATVWVAPKDAACEVAAKAARTVYAPKPTSGAGLSGSVRQTVKRPYVADVARVADGPVNQASALAFKPAIDYWEETLSVVVACRKLETGVLTAVEIDESRLISLATYAVSEEVQPRDPQGPAKPAHLTAQVQVPEVGADRVKGQWLIPHEHVLIVSLGVHTVQTPGGKSVVTERVAVITPDGEGERTPARPAPPADLAMTRAAIAPAYPGGELLPPLPIGESGRWLTADRAIAPARANLAGGGPIVISTPAQGSIIIIVQGPGQLETLTNLARNAPGAGPAAIESPAPWPDPAAPPTMPGLPSRSLPTPRNAQGDVVPLPPLPPDLEQADDPSGEPHGTPQTLPPQPAPSSEEAEPVSKPSGPGAVSHAPTYHALGRRLNITGIYHDGQGWVAKSSATPSAPTRSIGIDVQFHIRSCGAPETDSETAVEAFSELCRELADGAVVYGRRLTTSLGIDRNGNVIRSSSLAGARYRPATELALATPVVEGRAAAICGFSNLILRRSLQQHACAAIGTAHYMGAGIAAACLASTSQGAVKATKRDNTVTPAAGPAPAEKARPQHAVGLVLGGGASVQKGRLPGSTVIRLPVFGPLSILYRDDMEYQNQSTKR
jgi:hypothetical protein